MKTRTKALMALACAVILVMATVCAKGSPAVCFEFCPFTAGNRRAGGIAVAGACGR